MKGTIQSVENRVSANTKKKFQVITVVTDEGEEVKASLWPDVGTMPDSVVGKNVDFDIKKKGTWVNITEIIVSGEAAPQATPKGEETPKGSPDLAGLSRKDISMSKMSAIRAAAEQVASLIPLMVENDDPPSNDRIKELTESFADDYLAYILDSDVPK